MRIEYPKVAAGAYQAVLPLQHYVTAETQIEPQLRHLVELRASQINGCAFCLAMHSHQLRELGYPQSLIDLLPAWEETDRFSDREKSALAWTEAVTRVADTKVPDAVYEWARSQFSDRELVDLTFLVGLINLWNRLAISFRSEPQTYSN